MHKKRSRISTSQDDQQQRFSSLVSALILLSGLMLFVPRKSIRDFYGGNACSARGRGTAVTGTAFTQAQLGFGRFVSLGRSWQVLAVIVTIISLMAGAVRLTTVRAASASSQATSLPSIHVQGNKIVTATGMPVILRGVNRTASGQCIQQHTVFDGPVDLASVQALLSWKINLVRLTLNEDCWLGINGTYPSGPVYYQRPIKNYVNLLNQYGIYVIVDLHWNAPGTQLADRQQVMADASHGITYWQSVASAFKGNDRVIFDLYNEPSYTSWACWLYGGSACPGAPFQRAGMQQLVNAVRSTGATNILLANVPGRTITLLQWPANRPHDALNNLVAGFHTYGNNTKCDLACMDTYWAPPMAQVPVITGEFGESFDASICSNSYNSLLVPWLERHHTAGYAAWEWVPGQICTVLALITNWSGTPKYPNGTWYKAYLATVV